LPRGVVVPMHSHADRETFYVISGNPDAFRGDHWETLSPETWSMCKMASSTPGEIRPRRRLHALRHDDADGPFPSRCRGG